MFLEKLDEMTDREKDEFSKICNMLLSVTFVLRDNAERRISKEYRYIENRIELFEEYLGLCGWRIYKDSQYGIIYVKNVDGYNKLALNKLTTVMLLTMRIIFEEQRSQASGVYDVCTTVGELFGKIVNEISVYSKKPPQKDIKESFTILENHNLIRRLDDGYDDLENRFIILPSILIAIPNDKFRSMCEILKSETMEERNEETDEDATY